MINLHTFMAIYLSPMNVIRIIVQPLRFILPILICNITLQSCNPDEPETENGGGGGQQNQTFISYSDNGSAIYHQGEDDYIEALRDWSNEHGAEFFHVGMSFEFPFNGIGEHLNLFVSLPIDSSHMGNIPINTRLLLNDTISQTHFASLSLGSLNFEKADPSGTDTELSETDTTNFYNRITSIQYAGNHRYSAIEELVLCDYDVTGEFRIRVVNDITGEIRILENGQYKMKVAVIAE
jgi:hypothetical protein